MGAVVLLMLESIAKTEHQSHAIYESPVTESRPMWETRVALARSAELRGPSAPILLGPHRHAGSARSVLIPASGATGAR